MSLVPSGSPFSGGSAGMEMYDDSKHGNAEVYLIPGAESRPNLSSPSIEQFETMYNEGTPEFVVEQGLYYPPATNYGYLCTGIESPVDWDDHQRIFGLDGQEIQYAGGQTESLPHVYYIPSYGYAQSPYNPYNPYIPGATIGVDGPFMGTQQYYTFPAYENPVSLPAYYPTVVQPGPDIISNNTTYSFLDSSLFAHGADGPGAKPNLSSAPPTFSLSSQRPASNQLRTLGRVLEGPKAHAGPSKQPMVNGNVNSSNISNLASSQIFQGKGTHAVETIQPGKALSHRNQLKVPLSADSGLSNFGTSAYAQAAVAKVRPKLHYDRVSNDAIGIPNAITEQNRGPRTDKSKNHLAVKAYIAKAGETDAKGNIVIQTNQYNKDDFQVDYVNAKFFVIKSYSEDDVHKSIKYNVWSSTPNGNKKLEIAFQDAEKIAAGNPRGCPVFLFFSVNASGQFCGVAEMAGHVDFNRDMDFWQQDKWSGSFPVKWHIIKDVPNSNFRHIILENNENKPVTNSRDTQEIRFKQGTEMLKIFKNYSLKTSLLDDFMYYENRQRIMQQEKSRLLIKSYGTPFLVPALDPPWKLNSLLDMPSSEDEKNAKPNNMTSLGKSAASLSEQVPSDADASNSGIVKESTEKNANAVKDDDASSLKIDSLSMGPKQTETKPLMDLVAATNAAASTVPTTTAVADIKPIVLTVGSMPVKVNGLVESSGFLRVGTIPLDPRALNLDELNLGKAGAKE